MKLADLDVSDVQPLPPSYHQPRQIMRRGMDPSQQAAAAAGAYAAGYYYQQGYQQAYAQQPHPPQQQQEFKSQQEREQDYHVARQRIMGPHANGEAPYAAAQQPEAAAGGMQPRPALGAAAGYTAGGPGRGRGFNIGAAGRGGGRAAPGGKAMYRDRQREAVDPDYVRGAHRYQQRYDPGYGNGVAEAGNGAMYNHASYNQEVCVVGGRGCRDDMSWRNSSCIPDACSAAQCPTRTHAFAFLWCSWC